MKFPFPDLSKLQFPSILFINTNLLLEYRKNWRFLYSSASHDKSLAEMSSRICYNGPTILVVKVCRWIEGKNEKNSYFLAKDTEGNVFGAHASTSWIDTEGG